MIAVEFAFAIAIAIAIEFALLGASPCGGSGSGGGGGGNSSGAGSAADLATVGGSAVHVPHDSSESVGLTGAIAGVWRQSAAVHRSVTDPDRRRT